MVLTARRNMGWPAVLALAAVMLSGCTSADIDYPLAAPTWQAGDWWTYRHADGGASTVLVLASAGNHSLLARIPGSERVPTAGVDLLAVDRSTLVQEVRWLLAGESGTWTLDGVTGSRELPLARFPLSGPGDSWNQDTYTGLGRLFGGEGSATIRVASDGREDAAGGTVDVVRLTGTFQDTAYFLGLPLAGEEASFEASYAPAYQSLTTLTHSDGLASAYGWMMDPRSGEQQARLVSTGRGAEAPLQHFLRMELRTPPRVSNVVADSTTVALAEGQVWNPSARTTEDAFACTGWHDGTFRAWQGSRLVATAEAQADYGADDECERTAALALAAPFAGTLTFERRDTGLQEANALPLRIGRIQRQSDECVAVVEPCPLWSGTPAVGEQIWATLFALGPDSPVPADLVLAQGDTVLERVAWTSGAPVLFNTLGAGQPWALHLDTVGAAVYTLDLAVIPAAPTESPE